MVNQHRNLILQALPETVRAELLHGLKPIELPIRRVVFDLNQPLTQVYFPEDGVISIVSIFSNKTAIETGVVGFEGMVGLPLFLGADQMSAQAFAQTTSSGWLVPRAQFERALDQGPALRRLLGRYTQAFMTQVAQASACNRKHSIEERCARWLLMTADRAGESFDLTQQFLSQMLGVRRATVTVAAGVLQKAGLIEYTRGYIRIVDREALLEACCECYAIICLEQERLLGTCRTVDPLLGVKVSEGGETTTGPGDS